MEKRRVIGLALKGGFLPDRIEVSHLRLELDSGRSLILFGFYRRTEHDADEALRLALEFVDQDAIVVLKQLDLDSIEKPFEIWEKTFTPTFEGLENGDVWVAENLTEIYERIYLFEDFEESGGSLLRGRRRRPRRIRGLSPSLSPLIGRKKELEQFDELVEQIQEDQGQILSISGPPGIGKTRLREAFQTRVQGQKFLIVGSSFSDRAERRLNALREIAQEIFRDDRTVEAQSRLTESEKTHLKDFLEAREVISEDLSITEEARMALQFTLRKLLQEVSADLPLLVFLENFHLASEEEVEWLRHLTTEMEKHHVLLTVIHREEMTPPWKDQLNFNSLALAPLTIEEVESFLMTIFKVVRVSSPVVQKLMDLSQGNPLFVEEMARQLLSDRSIEISKAEKDTRVLHSRDLSQVSVPTSLQLLIASRFDALDSEDREVLRWASVLGSEFDLDDLAQLWMSKDLIWDENTVASLEEDGFLREKSVFPRRIFQFSHDLIYEVVLQSLGENELKTFHGEIASFLVERSRKNLLPDLERIAEHYLQSEQDLEAIEYAIEASKQASRSHQFVKAHGFAKAAADLWVSLPLPHPSATEVFSTYIKTKLALGRPKEAQEILQQWEKYAHTLNRRDYGLFAQMKMGVSLYVSDYKTAMTASKEAIDICGRDPLYEEERFAMIHDRINTMVHLGQLREALHESLSTLREINDGRYPMVRLRLWSRAAYCALTKGDIDLALDYLEKAKNVDVSHVSPQIQVEYALRLSEALEPLYRYDESRRVLSHALDIAQESGLRLQYLSVLSARASLMRKQGQFQATLWDLRTALNESKDWEDAYATDCIHRRIAQVLLDLGSVEEAQTSWDLQSSPMDEIPNPFERAFAYEVSARLFELSGDAGKARKHFLEAAQTYSKVGNQTSELQMRLFSLSSAVRSGTLSGETVSKELHSIENRARQLRSIPRALQDVYSLAKLRLHGHIEVKGSEPVNGFNPLECPNIPLRYELSSAKAFWMKARHKDEGWKELQKLIEEDRKKFEMSVPPEYLQSFRNHPLYVI